MIIAIPTLGRWNRQRTWHNLPDSLKNKTWLFVQQHESCQYKSLYQQVVVLPGEIRDVAFTRDYIVDWCLHHHGGHSVVVMCDDDLDFATRRDDEPTKFQAASQEDIGLLFGHLDIALDRFAHVSVSAREGANRVTENWIYNGRAMRILGFVPAVIKAHGLRFGPATFMCDFHMTLELLRLGYNNAILNKFVHNQPGSNNVPGGCTGQRTKESQAAAARWLADYHHPFVQTVTKTTKTSWGGEERLDVRVQWKAARGSAGQDRDSEILDLRTGKHTHQETIGPEQALE